MFLTPKWLLFIVFSFGIIHVIMFWLSDPNLTMGSTPSTSIPYSSSLSLGKVVSDLAYFNYSCLNGSFWLFQFILAAFQGVFVFFAIKEFWDYVRGR